jgi:STE24 endopeptidase
MGAVIYLIILIAILVGSYLLELIVESLNVRNISSSLPDEFAGFYDAERYRNAQNYLRENTHFQLITGGLSTAALVSFVLLGGFNVIDRFARGFGFGGIITGLIFAGTVMLIAEILLIPVSAYHTFVIEEKYGFNKTTVKTFFLDVLKSWILVGLIGGAAFSGILWFFGSFGDAAWLYSWIALTILQLVMLFIAPVVIMPLFNKYEPLEQGELKNAIEDYAKAEHFKLNGIFTMDGSKRSTKSNAFFTGFGKFRRIVLFDTLIEKHTVDELVAVLAHEIGHYKKKHILKQLLISIINSGVMLFIFSLFVNNQQFSTAFMMEKSSLYSSLIFFGILYTPISTLVSIVSNALSRKYEYESDAYVVSTFGKPGSMITALKKLSVDNLSNLTPHPLKVFLAYSHPPVIDRIQAIKALSSHRNS